MNRLPLFFTLSLLLLLTPAAGAHSVIHVLDRPLPEICIDGSALGEILDFYADVSDRKIEVDWRALAAVGVTRDTPVTTRVRNVKLSKAMTVTLDSAAGRPGVLGFEMRRGVIHVGRSQSDPVLAMKCGAAAIAFVAIAYSLCSHPRGSRGRRSPAA